MPQEKVSSELSGLLCEINRLDNEVAEIGARLLEMRHRYLLSSGWQIQPERIGPTITYFYRKDNQLFLCEHDAMDYEFHGA